MDHEVNLDPGPRPDRRRPTRPWDSFHPPARRAHHRRAEERDGTRCRFVDRYGMMARLQSILLLVLTLLDGALTVMLIDSPRQEANPLMAFALRRSELAFFATKYAITAACIPFLLIFRDYRMFGSRFRVGFLLPLFVTLYVMLLTCQVAAIQLAASVEARSRSFAAIHPTTSMRGASR